jgi:cell wall-associated NlpC family hydrolase
LDAAEFYNNLGKKDANSSSYAYDNALTNSLGSPAYNTSTPSDSPYPSAPARPSDARLDAKVAKNAQSLVGTKYYLGGRLPSNEGGLGVDCSGTALLSGERASGIGLRDRTADEMEKDPNLLREGHGQPGSMNFYDETGDGTYGHVTVVGNNGTEIHPSSNKGTINLVEQGYLDQFFSEKVNREYNWSYVYGY